MKKAIAIVLSVLLIFSLLPTAAFASEKGDEVHAKMVATRDYLYGEKTEFTAEESYDFLLYLWADGDGEKFKDGYVQSLKDAFAAGTMNKADQIGLAILCLERLDPDFDAEKFKLDDDSEVNLIDKIKENINSIDSDYNYFFLLLLCHNYDALEDIRATIDETIKSKYTMGKGYDYDGGYSTKNTANFAATKALEPDESPAEGKDFYKDARAIVEKAKTDKGYLSSDQEGAQVDGSSTANALFMHTIKTYTESLEPLADEDYDLLMNNFSKDDGSFANEIDGEANQDTTKDALKALSTYSAMFDEPLPAPTTETTTAQTTQQTTQQTTPATGDNSLIACGIAGAAVLALGIVLVTRKKEEK